MIKHFYDCLLWNLQIGNAVINDETDNLGMYDYFASHALISDKTLYQIKKHCDFGTLSSNECKAVSTEVDNDLENIDIYNIYAPLCHSSNLTKKPKKPSVSS